MNELINLRDGRAALERARATGEIRELKRIADLAAAAKHFAEAQKLSEDAKRFAAEMELDAKRYLGEVLAKEPKHPGGTSPGEVPPPKLADLGITHRQSHEAQKLATISEGDYEAWKSAARSDSLTMKRALRVAREAEAERRRGEPIDEVSIDGSVETRHGDLRSALDDLEGTVDAIITDPPYPAEFIEEFDALGELAARLLTPSGALVAMVGQSHLPAYLERLSRHLTYRWLGAYLIDGPAARVHARKVGAKWKPLLIFDRGGERRFLTQDTFTSAGDDKRHHRWGQSESGMADIVERLTEPGDLIVDPFLGGGTTALIARDLSRRFVGCDVDPLAVSESRKRLAA
jgi:site-specific DNA-methyltransferase (adenine-specific)